MKIEAKTLSNAKLFLIFNMLQKIITFLMNQVILLVLTPDIIGIASIQLELLLSTLLFLSREGIRLSVIRINISNSNDIQKIVNISWIPSILLLCVILLLLLILQDTITIIIMYSTAAFIECLGEPYYNIYQSLVNIRPKLYAETVGLFMKSLTTLLSVKYFNMGVHGFGIAQIVYAMVYLVTLMSFINTTITNDNDDNKVIVSHYSILPGRINSNSNRSKNLIANIVLWLGQWLDLGVLYLSITLMLSSLLKHILTESDKIALTLTASSYDQGVYAVASNYGSLVARLIFLPLEDSSRLAFSKQAVEFRKHLLQYLTLTNSSGGDSNSMISDSAFADATASLQAMLSLLIKMLRVVFLAGVIFVIFGIPYVAVAVKVVLGSKWDSPDTIRALSAYCVYIFILGINGITECFVQATSPRSAFGSLNIGLIGSSVIFAVAVIPSVQYLGTAGIVLANIASMVARIAFNARYILLTFHSVAYFFDKNTATNDNGVIAVLKSSEDNAVSSTDSNNSGCKVAEGYVYSDSMLPGITTGHIATALTPPLLWLLSSLTCATIVNCSAAYYSARANNTNKVINNAFLLHIAVGAVVGIGFLVVTFIFAAKQDRNSVIALVSSKLANVTHKSKVN